MRPFAKFYKVNGKPMLAPDEGVAMSFNDIDGSESGRDEAGFMHRIVIRYKVGTWPIEYSDLTEEEMRYTESLFPDSPDFDFEHPDRLDPTKQVTTRCYRSKYGVSYINARTGRYKNHKFNIIEC